MGARPPTSYVPDPANLRGAYHTRKSLDRQPNLPTPSTMGWGEGPITLQVGRGACTKDAAAESRSCEKGGLGATKR